MICFVCGRPFDGVSFSGAGPCCWAGERPVVFYRARYDRAVREHRQAPTLDTAGALDSARLLLDAARRSYP